MLQFGIGAFLATGEISSGQQGLSPYYARMSPRGDEGTRKERREAARVERKELEAREAARSARRKRLIQLGSLVAVVIVIVGVIVITSGGGKSAGPGNEHEKTQKATEVAALLEGIPQSGAVLGNVAAPVTLQYFGDLECPICKEFTLSVFPTLIQKYVRAGKLKVEYRSLETATREPETFKQQQVAALAAGKQGKAWDFIELFYHEQGEESSGYVTEAYLEGLARQIPGLNVSAWKQARKEVSLLKALEADKEEAVQHGFEGTPSFLLGKTGGPLSVLRVSTVTDPSPYEEGINKLLG